MSEQTKLADCVNCGFGPTVMEDELGRRVYWCAGCNNSVRSTNIEQARLAWQAMNEDFGIGPEAAKLPWKERDPR